MVRIRDRRRIVIQLWPLLAIAIGLGSQLPAVAQVATAPVDSVDRDYSAELPRLEPLSAEQALQAFEIVPGFRIELVASEPLVTDPVAFAFDSQGRLFVAEMRDYSEQETERLGRVALLEDTDHDGRMDRRTTFAENLSWPTAVWPWRDGVLVAEPPRLTWYRDLDGNGVSDQSEDWFVGFGRDNVQGLVNSLRWNIDGFLHGATSSTGAELNALAGASQTESGPIALRRRDFAIDTLTKTIQPEAGGGQHGLSFNRWGDKFVTSNSDHLQQVVDLDAWLTSHRTRIPFPAQRKSIAEDGPQAEVFRASPVEPWRVVRTRLRVTGVVPGIVEGGGRAAGYFTGATGTWIMDREAQFGPADTDVAMVCDVGSNLVHRKRLTDQGLFWTGGRMDERTEFLRSTDTWFRPVQLGDGPDGALYIADMYREVIEHPKSLPSVIKRHLDLTSGRDRGRIWRIVPTSLPQPAAVPAMTSASTSELVAGLDDTIRWRRNMASQLLVEREKRVDIVSWNAAVSKLRRPEAIVAAAHIANRLGILTFERLGELLESEHPRVAEHALKLVRAKNWAHELDEARLSELAARSEPRIQLELAMLLADLPVEQSRNTLSTLMLHADLPMVQAAIATAAGAESWKLLASLPQFPAEARAKFRVWLTLLLPSWINELDTNVELRAWINSELASPQGVQQALWCDVLAALPKQSSIVALLRAITPASKANIEQFIESRLANNPPSQVIQWARLLDSERQIDWSKQFLQPTATDSQQREAVELARATQNLEIVQLAISTFPTMTPALQQYCLRTLSEQNRQELLEGVDAEYIRRSQIPLDIRQVLLADSKTKTLATKLLGQSRSNRRAAIDRYASDLDIPIGDAAILNGRAHFQRVCAQCHQLDGIGHDVGAALKQLGDKSPTQLLEAILDPNREIDPRFAGYTILLADGSIIAGVIREESATQITVKAAGGKEHIVQRQEIDQIKSTGVSLMPEGMEEQLDETQMRELIGFLISAH